MQSLETYPPKSGEHLISSNSCAYKSAEKCVDENSDTTHTGLVGTLSESEWHVFTLYLAFCFQKNNDS